MLLGLAAIGSIFIGANLVFTDHGPTAAINETGAGVSSDESAGNQTDSNDVDGPLAVFNGVTDKGVDPDGPTGPMTDEATNGPAVAPTAQASSSGNRTAKRMGELRRGKAPLQRAPGAIPAGRKSPVP